ncbi:MAG: deoxyribose-phosphate aldolase [Legionellales bacterium]|nr:deoxyribose-phosphate aldolase [Legionellales bacterium]
MPMNNNFFKELLRESEHVICNANHAQKLIRLLDLTNLNLEAKPDDIIALSQQAATPYGHVAAICVYEKFIPLVKQSVTDAQIKIASVANFPAGTGHFEEVTQAIHLAIEQGANEIDVVMPYQDYLKGHTAQVSQFIKACKLTCGPQVVLKVILETGALSDPNLIYQASLDCIESGADFIKTSTGKIQQGASLQAAFAMLTAIKDQGGTVGFKASGGISKGQQALQYLYFAEHILGKAFIQPTTLRFGASSLLMDLLKILST